MGYTTENNKYVNSKESIIFDDFTLDTKFVDFPYMVKSSAIKILTLKDEKKDNIRFNFELLSNHRFNMLGHARHYISVVQPEEVFTTNKQEQDKIGELFTNLDNLITLHQRKQNSFNLYKAFTKFNFIKINKNTWEQRKLGEIINETIDNRGKNPPYYCESGIPVIDNFMIKNNGYPDLKTATRYLDDYLFSNFIRKHNEKDDVLITLVGNGIGNIALFPKEKSAIVQNTIGMRFEQPKKFKYYSLLSKNNEIVKLDRGMAQPSIRQDELKNLDINLPTEKEQSKIESLMTNLDNLITLHHRKYIKFFYSWEQRKAKDICSISTGKSNTQDKVDGGKYPFYVRSEIVEHSNRYLYDEQAVLTVGDGVGTGKVFHYVDGKYDLHQRVYRCFGFDSKVFPKYYFYYFSTHFYNRVMAMTAKTSVDSVRYEMISEMDFKLPKYEEQRKISSLIDNLDNLITLHQHKELKRRNDKNEHLRW